MRICLAMLDTADVVVFLDDYQSSPGALVEYQYSVYVGKPMMMYKAIIERGAQA